MIQFACNGCGKTYSVRDELAGRQAKCKVCQKLFTIPVRSTDVWHATGATREATEPAGVVPPPVPLLHPRKRTRKLVPWHIVSRTGILLVLVAIPLGLPYAYRFVAKSLQKSRATPDAITPAIPIFPDLPSPLHVDYADVYRVEIDGSGPGVPMKVWLYIPAGVHAGHSLPCVFIAPAGSRMLHGMPLANGDMQEHFPYVRAGFVVAAYGLSGTAPAGESITYGELVAPIREFMAANGGLTNERLAVDFVLAKVPEVDPAQLFAAGHSSAGTMALNAAAADHRFRAVAAYASRCDVVAHWQNDLPTVEKLVPGASSFAARVSPIRHANDIRCPVLLFHADDDSRVPTSDNEEYYEMLLNLGKSVEFKREATGEHFQSMIDHRIPSGIEFFKSQGARPQPASSQKPPSVPTKIASSTAKHLVQQPIALVTPQSAPSPRPFRTFRGSDTLRVAGPAWKVAEIDMALLGPEQEISGYAIRPPSKSIRTDRNSGATWRGPAATFISMTVVIDPRLDQTLYPSVKTDNEPTTPVHQTIGLLGGSKECGSIDAIPFVRAFLNDHGMTDIIYTAFDQDRWIIIRAKTNDQKSLQAIEAAARTFHRIKR